MPASRKRSVVQGERIEAPCQLDDGRKVVLSTKEYRDLEHGYAATIHKTQGVTVDPAYVLASKIFDRHAGYVALTRHREHCEVRFGPDEF